MIATTAFRIDRQRTPPADYNSTASDTLFLWLPSRSQPEIGTYIIQPEMGTYITRERQVIRITN